MKNLLRDVAAFHMATDVPILDRPAFPESERVALRENLHAEEYTELRDAIAARDMVETADAIADLIYVLVGTALEFGIPLDRVWDAVQRANMAKVDPATGKVRKRDDGKILKPDGWTPPDIEGIIREAAEAPEDGLHLVPVSERVVAPGELALSFDTGEGLASTIAAPFAEMMQVVQDNADIGTPTDAATCLTFWRRLREEYLAAYAAGNDQECGQALFRALILVMDGHQGAEARASVERAMNTHGRAHVTVHCARNRFGLAVGDGFVDLRGPQVAEAVTRPAALLN